MTWVYVKYSDGLERWRLKGADGRCLATVLKTKNSLVRIWWPSIIDPTDCQDWAEALSVLRMKFGPLPQPNHVTV